MSLRFRLTLLKAMHHASRLQTTLEATSRLLRQVSSKIRHMGEVEVGTTKVAMTVSIDNVFCSAKTRWEVFGVVAHRFLIHRSCLQALVGRVVVARYKDPFGEDSKLLNGQDLPGFKTNVGEDLLNQQARRSIETKAQNFGEFEALPTDFSQLLPNPLVSTDPHRIPDPDWLEAPSGSLANRPFHSSGEFEAQESKGLPEVAKEPTFLRPNASSRSRPRVSRAKDYCPQNQWSAREIAEAGFPKNPNRYRS